MRRFVLGFLIGFLLIASDADAYDVVYSDSSHNIYGINYPAGVGTN